MARKPKRREGDTDTGTVDFFRGWDTDPSSELPCDRKQMMSNATDNRRCPKYVALAGAEGDYVEADEHLAELLDELADTPGDVAVWNARQGTLAAVIHRGQPQVFEAEPASHNGTGSNGHTTNGHTQNGTAKKPKLFGHAVCSILLWMGKQGWGFTEAKVVLNQLHMEVTDLSIRSQLSAGRTGRLPAPTLSRDQQEQLQRLREAASSGG
jgi:hypothetical protein